MIKPCHAVGQSGWLALRKALWPQDSDAQHLEQMATFVTQPERFAQYVAYAEHGRPAGFIEVALRYDYVNETKISPVAFLEGIYAAPAYRRRGFARSLTAAATDWAVRRGVREFASDAALDNEASHLMHRSLGFEETERVVYFRKMLSAK